MGAKLLPLILVLSLATSAAGVEKAPAPPDQDMLEFLGTFETSGGKEIDPLLLEGMPGKPAPTGKTATRRPSVRKPFQKETPPKGRENDDE